MLGQEESNELNLDCNLNFPWREGIFFQEIRGLSEYLQFNLSRSFKLKRPTFLIIFERD